MRFGDAFVGIVTGVITLAIVAVVFGARAQTSAVIQSGGSALANVINAAVSPVTGSGGGFGGGGGPNIGNIIGNLTNPLGALGGGVGGGFPLGG